MIVSPDARTARYLAVCIGRDTSCELVTVAKGFEKKITAFLGREQYPVLIVVPSEKMPFSVVDACDHCTAADGLSLVWAKKTANRDDGWLLLKLLENSGAMVCEELDTLALAAKLFQDIRPQHGPFTMVVPVDTKTAVMNHLANALSDTVSSDGSEKPAKNAPRIKLSRAAQIMVTIGKRNVEIDAAPTVVGRAMNLLCAHFSRTPVTAQAPEIQIEEGTVSMIARPPARILSETTSKRLLAAFGLSLPNELLCDSPSKAVRFAKKLGGPATLKLVRPNFRASSATGGLITDVVGPSDTQKAYQSLLSLSKQMGGPKPLGILVCEQVETAHLFWLDAKRHKQLGRVIYFGRRDETSEHPAGVVTLPCSFPQCLGAIQTTFPNIAPHIVSHFADAMFRMGTLCSTLGEHIGIAQIHPLAITDEGALMLDAVMGITDFSGSSPEETKDI